MKGSVSCPKAKSVNLYFSPDELSEILANLSVSPDTALRHIDALMGAEFTDMLVHEGEKGGLCLDAALQGLLDILSLEVRSLFHKNIESLLDGKQQLLDVLVGLHGFLALAPPIGWHEDSKAMESKTTCRRTAP